LEYFRLHPSAAATTDQQGHRFRLTGLGVEALAPAFGDNKNQALAPEDIPFFQSESFLRQPLAAAIDRFILPP
jgi:hypothetical protein